MIGLVNHWEPNSTSFKLQKLLKHIKFLKLLGRIDTKYGLLIPLSVLKIISFIEPLKPFLTILAEVIVLVTAILLYEKFHSRKNTEEGR